MTRRGAFILSFLGALALAGTTASYAENLFELAKGGAPLQVQAAVDAGADVNERGRNGVTPLMLAALFNRDPDVIQVLIKAGARLADTNSDGRTALQLAAQFSGNPAGHHCAPERRRGHRQ